MSKKRDFIKGIEGLQADDLKVQLEQSKQRLKKLEFAHAITPVENPMSIRTLRKDIARISTLIKSKQQAAKA